MKTTVSTDPERSSSRRKTIWSPFFVVICFSEPTIPPTVTTSPSRRRSSSEMPAVGLARQRGANPVQRMLGDVQPEALLLEPQQILLAVLARREPRMVPLRHTGVAAAEVEDRALAGEHVGLVA